jgi:uroporphyrinogen-III synthase
MTKPLAGWRVIVPRGGEWGERVAADLRAAGASPIVAPLINFAPAADTAALDAALQRLEAGTYDWLVVSSATTVDVFSAMRTVIPPTTKIAAVGETTATALATAGYRCDFVPTNDSSAIGLVNELPLGNETGLRILLPQSEIAEKTLLNGLLAAGHRAEQVTAYRTVGVPAGDAVVEAVASGEVRAILVTSGSIAQQVSEQFGDIPENTLVVAIGPRTAHDALALGLPVDFIARERSADSLVEALIEAAEDAE